MIPGDREASIQSEIASYEQQRLDALSQGDVEGLAELMSDDCVIVHGSGLMESKTEFLRIFERMNIRSIDQTSTIIRPYGEDTAAVVNTTEMRSSFVSAPENEIIVCHHQTTVWHKAAGRWRFNIMHNTRIPQPD